MIGKWWGGVHPPRYAISYFTRGHSGQSVSAERHLFQVDVGGHNLVLVDSVGLSFTVEVTGEIYPVGHDHRHHYEHGEVGHGFTVGR